MSCINVLKQKGLKLTPQRRLIMEFFHSTESHLTAEDIIEFVQAKMPGVNKSTIYRTLELLADTGCVYKSMMGEQAIYHHAEEGHHHHLFCHKCGKTIDCDEDLFLPMEKTLMENFGFHVDFKHVVMNGVCKECLQTAK